MKGANHGGKPYAKAKNLSHLWWLRVVGYAKRKLRQRAAEKEKESLEHRAIRWTMWATVAIALFTIVLAGVGYLQYIDIRDSGVESSDQMNQMIHEYRSQVAQLKRQAGDTRNLATAAITQADVANQTMQIDQRPWVNLTIGQPLITEGIPIKTPVHIINSGKTPAYNVTGLVVLNLLKYGEQPDFNLKPRTHPKFKFDVRALIPNFPNDLQWAILPKFVPKKPVIPILGTSDIRQGIQDGSLYIVVHGRITYSDTFGVDHWTNFCTYIHNETVVPLKATAETCGAYNDVDKNYQRKK